MSEKRINFQQKVPQETSERLESITQELMEAGVIINKGDVLTVLADLFEKDKLSQTMRFGADLKELGQVTNRINEIFLHLLKRTENDRESIEALHAKQVEEMQLELAKVKEAKNDLEQILVAKEEELMQLMDDVSKSQELIEKTEQHNLSLEERIEELKSTVKDKEIQSDNKDKLLAEQLEIIDSMKQDIAKVDELNEVIAELNDRLKEQAETIKEKEKLIEDTVEKMEFECSKRVFEKEQELQAILNDRLSKELEKREEINNRYNELIIENRELDKSNNELRRKLEQALQKNQELESEIIKIRKDNK